MARSCLAMAGRGWSLSALCPWRVRDGHGIRFSWSEAGERVSQLVGLHVVSASTAAPDASFVLSDGSSLDLFADTDTDPFVVRLPGSTWVGPLRE